MKRTNPFERDSKHDVPTTTSTTSTQTAFPNIGSLNSTLPSTTTPTTTTTTAGNEPQAKRTRIFTGEVPNPDFKLPGHASVDTRSIKRVIYGVFLPMILTIDGQEYHAAKIGAMGTNGQRFDDLTSGWNYQLNLPSPENVQGFFDAFQNGVKWDYCLEHLGLKKNHLLFLVLTTKDLSDDEHTIRTGLCTRFGGFPLPRRAIQRLHEIAHQPSPAVRLENLGPTEYIALKIPDVQKIRKHFIAKTIGLYAHKIKVHLEDDTFKGNTTSVLKFGDDYVNEVQVKNETAVIDREEKYEDTYYDEETDKGKEKEDDESEDQSE